MKLKSLFNPLISSDTRKLLVATALVAGALSARADYASSVLSENPFAYFRFTESATTIPEPPATNRGSLGTSGDGAYLGSVARGATGALAGRSDPSTTFDGSGARVTVPFSAPLSLNPPFTVEAWVKPTQSPPPAGQSSLAAVLSCGRLADPRSGWLIYQSATGWNLRMYTGTGTGTGVNITGGPTPVVDTWYHLAAVYDGTTAYVYVNGELKASAAVTAFAANADGNFTIGTRSDVGFNYSGGVDEAALYTTALSASEILAHYANGTNTAPATPYEQLVLNNNPIVYLRLNEAPLPVVVVTNSGSLGTVANGSYLYPAASVDGPRPPGYPAFEAGNNAVGLNGVSANVRIPQAGNLTNPSLTSVTEATFLCWVKRNGAQGEYKGLLAMRPTSTGLYLNNDDTLNYSWNDAGNTWGFNSALIPPDGEWTLAAVVVRPDYALFYMGSLSGGFVSASNGVTHAAANFTTGPFAVGRDINFGGAGRYFNGAIDEAVVYTKALTEGYIRSLFYTGVGSNLPPSMVSDPPTASPGTTVYSTTSFTLTAEVAGALPIYYQWRKNGVDIPGANSVIYTKSGIVVGDTGNYDVVATNNFGAVTSLVVAITVDPAVPPSVTLQPASRSVYPGGKVTFTAATVSGTLPFTYQWKKNGVNIAGATGQTLTLTAVTAGDAANYTVGVTNVAGGTVSSAAALALITPAPGYEATLVGMRPKAYWRLGETSGTVAYDYFGGNDGTYNNVTLGATGAVAGDANRAATFDGASSFVGTTPLLNGLTNFSLVGWVRRGGGQLARTGLFGQNDNFEFGYISDQTIQAWDSVPGNNLDAANPLADATWGFVVVTTDTANRTIYVNGRQVARGGGRTSSLTNGFNFNIGGGGIFDGTGNWFLGDLDEVAVFDRALSVQEICALYLKGTGYVGSFEPTIASINGAGEQTLTNVNFTGNDGGFAVDTPNAAPEANWIYDGASWWSAGQANAFGANNNVSYLISPTNTVTRAGVLRLTFSHRYSFERDTTSWDGGAVEVSVNGGPWVYVAAAQFDQNGYSGVVQSADALVGKNGFIGNSPGHPSYITSSCLVVGANPGDKVNVRFVAAYDNNTTGNLTPSGWQIASVQLSEGVSNSVLVSCPCGSLESKQGDIVSGTWVDLGAASAVISTTKTNQQYFRIKR